MSSANFTQVSGPGGRVQTLVPGGSQQTFLWNPSSLKGQLDGGDFIYARRIKLRTTGFLTNTVGTGPSMLNWQQIQQTLGNVRVFSQFLGEMVPKSLNTVSLLTNHDAYFVNGFKPITRKRPVSAATTGVIIPFEIITEIPFERDYLERSLDSCPWMPFLEGGQIECDLSSTASLTPYGWTPSGNWAQSCTIDWYTDRQPLIHAPVQSRLYRVTTTGPEYVLRVVGAPNGLDGVTAGSRLALLSWLFQGTSATGGAKDNGFYSNFGGGGFLPGTALINRLDIPFRSQVSIDDVNAWIEAFLSDVGPTRYRPNAVQETAAAPGTRSNDLSDWPNVMDPVAAETGYFANTSLMGNQLDFFPLIWPQPGQKISDMQKVNGDLSLTVSFGGTPPGNVLNLFRSDEVCGFTPQKVYDIMERMGLRHEDMGGQYNVVPKYAGGKKADLSTIWGFPLKIIKVKGG
jgi:hypothetical protein